MKIIFWIFFYFIVCFLTPLHSADQEQKYQGVSFVCTGVGESKEDPQWKAYPLKLIFAASGRAYVAEVKVEIKDAAGQTLLKTNCDGPWLLVKLKAGNYQVQASADGGGVKNASIKVPETGQNEIVMRFASIPVGDGQ